jgi:hypothetical protein
VHQALSISGAIAQVWNKGRLEFCLNPHPPLKPDRIEANPDCLQLKAKRSATRTRFE